MSKKAILVADPDGDFLKSFGTKLVKSGFAVIKRESVKGALESLVEYSPDAVITDIDFKDGSFLDIIEAVRESESPATPVLVLTGMIDLGSELKAIEAGADAFFSKSLEIKYVISSLQDKFRVAELVEQVKTLKQENTSLQKKLLSHADRDPETGFFSMKSFKKVVTRELRIMERSNQPVSVAMMSFAVSYEAANMRDRMITEACMLINAAIRDIDIPVRYTADQLMLMLPFTHEKGAKIICERLRKSVHERFMGDDCPCVVLNIGVATADNLKSTSFGRIVKTAVKALKEAEENGGNTVVCEMIGTSRRNSFF